MQKTFILSRKTALKLLKNLQKNGIIKYKEFYGENDAGKDLELQK